MLGRRANKPGGGVAEKSKIAVDRTGRTATTTMASPLFAPPKLFLATSAAADVVASPEHAEVVMSPTSPAASSHMYNGGAAPFCRGDRRSMNKNQSHRPWEARPVRLGLAGALNGEATEAATTVLTGQRPWPAHTVNPPCSHPPAASKEFDIMRCRGPESAGRSTQSSACRCMSPREMEASEDYTLVIARGLSAGSGEDEFLRWCHGCSKDLGQDKDIFMYRGEMAFCSHECRYREMLFDEKL